MANMTWLSNDEVERIFDKHSHVIESVNWCAYCDEEVPCPTFRLAEEVLRIRRAPRPSRHLSREVLF